MDGLGWIITIIAIGLFLYYTGSLNYMTENGRAINQRKADSVYVDHKVRTDALDRIAKEKTDSIALFKSDSANVARVWCSDTVDANGNKFNIGVTYSMSGTSATYLGSGKWKFITIEGH
jgi:hypothetical protein